MAPQNPPADRQLEALGLENRWEAQATLDVTRDVISHITNDEEIVYVQSSAGSMTALHAENGRRLWTRQVGRSDNPSLAAISNSKLVIVAAGPELIGMDKFTGAQVFRHRLPTQPTAAPAVDERRLFVPVEGGAVYVYSLQTLAYLSRYKVLPPDEARAHLYKFVCGENITRAPVVGEKTMAFISDTGNFYSVETDGGSPGGTRFQLVMSGAPSSEPAITQGENGAAALVLTGDDQVHQIDMTSGTTEWAFPMGRTMTQSPVAVGAGAYIVTRDRVLTKLNRDDRIGPLGRPIEIPNYSSPNVIGVGLKEVELSAEASELVNVQATTAVEVAEVAPNSPAEAAGLITGDVIVVADGLEASSTEAAARIFAELPLRISRRLLVIRNGELLRLKIRIQVREWEASGVKTLLTVGRYAVFGMDGAGRLVAIDRQKGEAIGVTEPTGFSDPVINSRTDQIYLATSTGRVICIREIGPTITVPEFTPLTQFSTVSKIHVQVGDLVASSGTPLCDVVVADGSTYTVTSDHAGIVQRIMIREGSSIMTGSKVLRIADDQFATYHQRPQQRPVDVDLGTSQPANGQ
ncbi:MAG: PQQ-binding-like beta-propeller repeat protein [Fuerstiella sp.]